MFGFKMLFYLFSIIFPVFAIYTLVLKIKKKQFSFEDAVFVVFSFAIAILSFYFAHWGIIIEF